MKLSCAFNEHLREYESKPNRSISTIKMNLQIREREGGREELRKFAVLAVIVRCSF